RDPEAPPTFLWPAHVWLEKFKIPWGRKYGGFYGQAGDAKACNTLADQLSALPSDERVRVQGRADAIIAEFLASSSPTTVQRKHPFAFFVGDFGALRVGKAEPNRPPQTA